MIITSNDSVALFKTISITVEGTDYAPSFNAELKKYKNQATIRGFRKGKAPDNMLKSMYGPNILANLIEEKAQSALKEYIKENNINHLFSPTISEDQEKIALDYKDLTKNYTFQYDLILVSNFDIKGVSSSDTYTMYKVVTEEKDMADYMTKLAENNGDVISVDTVAHLDEKITFEAVELDGNAPKVDGHTTDLSISMPHVDFEEFKNTINGKKLGDTFDYDVFQIESKDDKYIKKYLLNLGEDQEVGHNFRLTISDITRKVPAEITEEWAKNKFGLSLDELKENVASMFESSNKESATNLMHRSMMLNIINSTDVQFSKEKVAEYFVKYEKMKPEDVEKNMNDYMDELKWIVIRERLMTTFNVQILEEDIDQEIYKQMGEFSRQFGHMDQNMVQRFMKYYKNDEKELNKIALKVGLAKAYAEVEKVATIVEEEISTEAFIAKVNEQKQ